MCLKQLLKVCKGIKMDGHCSIIRIYIVKYLRLEPNFQAQALAASSVTNFPNPKCKHNINSVSVTGAKYEKFDNLSYTFATFS